MNNFAFDLDGVIRDLYTAIEKKYKFKIKGWFWTYKEMDVFDLAIHDKYKFIIDSPTTKYYRVIKKHFPEPEIWTYQRPSWRKNTLRWLKKHFKSFKLKFYTPKQKFYWLQKRDIFLVEDYPLFPNYNKIILIDNPQNQQVKCPYRIKRVKELERLFK